MTDAQRAEALRAAAGVRALRGDASGAAGDYAKALVLLPGDADALIGMARALGDSPERALPYAERAAGSAATAARRAAAHRLAAEFRLDLGDDAGALAAIESALKEAPDDLDALRDMVRIKRGRPKDAAVYAERAYRAAGGAPLWSRPEAFRLCARIWLEINDYARAEDCLRRALAVDPDDLDALESLVQLKHEGPRRPAVPAEPAGAPPADEVRPEEAVTAALRADPGDLDALRRLVALRRGQNRLKEAAALAQRFTDAVEDAPAWQQAPAYRLITRTWLDLGDAPQALETLWKARDMDPRSLATGKLGEEMKVPGPTVQDALSTIVRAREELSETR
ncbi:MAG: hypothetical protein ACHQ51_11725 [Elusimicrobiota bacterium]